MHNLYKHTITNKFNNTNIMYTAKYKNSTFQQKIGLEIRLQAILH